MKFQAMKVRTITTLTLGFLTATVFLPAREIGFVEKFSLADYHRGIRTSACLWAELAHGA